MSHRVEIDRRSTDTNGRRVERSSTGRVSAEYVSISEEDRRTIMDGLSRRIEGDVLFDAGSRALYATDASNYRQVPIGVVVPKSIDDVLHTLEVCRKNRIPILARGGGTSLAGETCNVAVVIDFSKHLDHIVSIDPDAKRATVEPGCILDVLRKQAERHSLTFGPDPATHDHNTLGGMLGNNSCGVHSVMAGRTSDNVRSMEIVTGDGLQMTVGPTDSQELETILEQGGRRAEIYRMLDVFRKKYGELIVSRYPKIPRRVSGYENLDELLPEKGFNIARALVGTEGTCVTILNATLDLVHSPSERVLAILGFEDVFAAADAVPEVLASKPIGLEGIDHLLIEFIREKHVHPEDARLLPEGRAWLVAEMGADRKEEANSAARDLAERMKNDICGASIIIEQKQQKRIWELREAALAATAHVPGMPESYPGWEDSAVPRENLGGYLRELTALFDKHGYKASVYGHFGDGLVHCRVPFDLRTERGVADWQQFLTEAADLVVRYGGSLSGEHGDGQARAALLERMYGPQMLEAFREFKAIWDPDGLMNPGKVVAPFPTDANLRVGPLYQPPQVVGVFAYEEDGGSFTKATRRCVGVGACRRIDSEKSVMCPSYMATREEKWSTRGRARLLFEMLHGGAIEDRWASEAVEESLDFCLACKACKKDCPVSVDMATYKAEFRHRHYRNRMRPRAAYTLGQIHRWSRLAGYAPWLANILTQTPVLSAASKTVAGIAQQRRIPRYSSPSLSAWFSSRSSARQEGRPRVILWPDTFTNHFRAPTGIDAVQALEMLGYQVAMPQRWVCCGRPLYDWGLLDEAKALWRNTFDVMRNEIRVGTPIVCLEPSCASAFRDELPSLFRGDERAQQLSRSTLLLSEFLDREQVDLPRLPGERRALAQLHCHHHSILDTKAEEKVLDRLGVDTEFLASGCCGMAGPFGFERAKYDISMAAAERVLFPRVKGAPEDTIIVADGFSCREQIEQGTGRRTKHLAQLLRQALSS
ncbi:FAD-binding and (Fe-S)-binding domain-containing protein [Mesorhizobium sp. ES1-3]|uniref:FAD-binding and (Fe-S)-binding domain-containing protein n=1 Tax=Mesorhizobium sp. ES1-3 TaxID=2876628 RepID=UPI001CCEA821|nr:FAD-binding and (Fe-S)-binding domain-containing protein [Mesorhizobium sp. ES1-3]MBZ9673656.1 FAD-binding oxidoreductase [Mesorhizobium sp. ES1-3]